MKQRRGKAFLWVYGVLVVSALGCVAGVNLAVDPYRAYGWAGLERFEAFKNKSSRVQTAALVDVDRPDVVITGSSRTVRGIDPRDEAWRALAGAEAVVRNAAMPQTHAREMVWMVELAVERGARRVVLFVDFHMFGPRQWPVHDFVRSKLNPSLGLAGYHLGNLLSIDSLMRSKDVFERQQDGRDRNEVYARTGFRLKASPAEVAERRARFNPGRAFDAMVRGSLRRHAMYGPSFGYRPQVLNESIGQIKRACEAGDVQLMIAIMPVHAVQLETIRVGGWWEQCEMFKRDLVRVAGGEGGGSRVAVYDFATYNTYTTEPVERETGRAMKWWWESSHSTKELGYEVIEVVTGRKEEGALGGFGVLIREENIEAHLAAVREAREAYAESHAEEIERVRRIAHQAREETASTQRSQRVDTEGAE